MISSRIPSNLLVSRIATDIANKQNDLAAAQERIASGKQVNRPSDAPAQAAHIITLRETTSQLDQFERNASNAESQLSLEETALTGTANTLMRVRELALSANSGAVDDTTRAAVNAEVKLRLDELYELANAKDSFGNYLFAGTHSHTRPFSPQSPVNYQGSDDAAQSRIGPGRKIQTGDSGADVFMRIRNGNGDFEVRADAANLGTGIISQGSMTDRSAYDARPYTIQFSSSNAFDILDATTGTVIQGGNTYTPGEAINFNGMSSSIGGKPQAGDSFQLLPSSHQDVFTTVAKFVDTLERSPQTPAELASMQQSIDSIITNIDQSLDHINTARARVGTRLNSIDSSRDENAAMLLQLQRTQSDIEDIDIAEAVTDLQTQANSLEILQKSFSRIEGLSLFNFL